MSSFDVERKKLIDLCNLVAEGKLTFDELEAQWPSSLTSTFVKLIREDIEDAVEHFPAKIFARTPDWEMWRKSKLYFLVLVDRELLQTNYSESILLSAKYRLNKIKFLSVDQLKKEVERVLLTEQ